MRKIALALAFLLVVSLFFSYSSFLHSDVLAYGSTSSGTDIQGILWDNTTWTAANSPYIITGTVEIPSNATLTIEAGVTIAVDSSHPSLSPLFLVNGTINAYGRADDKIVFDGGGSSSFFTLNNDSAYLDLDYCTIKNGNSLLYQGHGSFCLCNCLLDTLCYQSIIRSQQDIYIVNSTFANTASFYVESAPTILMENDLFTRNSGPILVMGDGSAVVSNSSFVNTNGYVLKLSPEGSGANPTIDAANNYWGTTNTTLIDSTLYDEHIDPSINGSITYQPILQTASANAPPDSYNLTIYTIGDGTVTPSNATYAAYSTVNLSASSALGWSFSGWSGDASDSNANTTITMDSNKTVTATFASNWTSITAATIISIIIIISATILVRQKFHSQYTKADQH